MPATRKGSTSQLGMRRLRKSVMVATVRTTTLGHQAMECIETPVPRGAIRYPNSACVSRCLRFRPLDSYRSSGCARLYTAWASTETPDTHWLPRFRCCFREKRAAVRGWAGGEVDFVVVNRSDRSGGPDPFRGL